MEDKVNIPDDYTVDGVTIHSKEAKQFHKNMNKLREKNKKHSNRHKHTWIEYKDFNKAIAIKCKDCNKVSYPNKYLYKRFAKGCFGKPKYWPPLDTKAWKEKCKQKKLQAAKLVKKQEK